METNNLATKCTVHINQAHHIFLGIIRKKEKSKGKKKKNFVGCLLHSFILIHHSAVVAVQENE